MTPLESALDALADAVAAKVVERLTAGQHAGFVDQAGSPLGRRRHIAAVRRLVAAGAPGAAIVGRRALLSRAALDAELAALKPRSRAKTEAPNELDALRDRLGFEKVRP